MKKTIDVKFDPMAVVKQFVDSTLVLKSKLGFAEFRFAGVSSALVALEAFVAAVMGERAAFVICGPSGSGKSRLARLILKARSQDAAMVNPYVLGVGLRDALYDAVCRGALLMECEESLERGGAELKRFLTSDVYTGRISGTRHYFARNNRCLTVITAPDISVLSPDMERRVKVIHLEGPAEKKVSRAVRRRKS